MIITIKSMITADTNNYLQGVEFFPWALDSADKVLTWPLTIMSNTLEMIEIWSV